MRAATLCCREVPRQSRADLNTACQPPFVLVKQTASPALNQDARAAPAPFTTSTVANDAGGAIHQGDTCAAEESFRHHRKSPRQGLALWLSGHAPRWCQLAQRGNWRLDHPSPVLAKPGKRRACDPAEHAKSGLFESLTFVMIANCPSDSAPTGPLRAAALNP